MSAATPPTRTSVSATTHRAHPSRRPHRNTRSPAAAAVRHPMPRRHQIPANILPGPDQIPRRLTSPRPAPRPRRSHPDATNGPDAEHHGRRSLPDPHWAAATQAVPRPDNQPRQRPRTWPTRNPSDRPHTSPPPDPATTAPTTTHHHAPASTAARTTPRSHRPTRTPPPTARAHPARHSYADLSLGPPTSVALPARTTLACNPRLHVSDTPATTPISSKAVLRV